MEALKIALPLITFIAGFLLNRMVERRKIDKGLARDSAVRALGLLSEWHAVISELAESAYSVQTLEEIQALTQKYQTKRYIAGKLEFELSLLGAYKEADRFVGSVRTISHWHHGAAGPLPLDQLESVLAHEQRSGWTTLCALVDSYERGDQARANSIEKTKQAIHDFYAGFEKMLLHAIREATPLVRKFR